MRKDAKERAPKICQNYSHTSCGLHSAYVVFASVLVDSAIRGRQDAAFDCNGATLDVHLMNIPSCISRRQEIRFAS